MMVAGGCKSRGGAGDSDAMLVDNRRCKQGCRSAVNASCLKTSVPDRVPATC